MKFFTSSLDKHLGTKIAQKLGAKICPMEVFVFPDGEKRIKLNDTVVDEDTYLLKSTGIPSDSNLMELFFIIDALKRSGARSVTAIIPYLAYSRQDHVFREGEDVSLQVVIKTLENIGMDKIISFDFHSIKIPEFFSVPVVHLSALSLFAEEIKKISKNSSEPFVLVSPDMGGIRRIKELAQDLGDIPIATILKDRDLKTGNIEISNLDGDVRGKTAFIVDDIASTGLTLSKACDLLLENGATKVYAFATHPLLAADASNVLQKSDIEKVFVTDIISIPDSNKFAKLEVISVAEIIVQAIKNS